MTSNTPPFDPRQLILDALDDPGAGIQDLFFVLRMSAVPKAEYVSSGMQNLFALPTDRLYESLERLWEGIHPDDHQKVREALADPSGHSTVVYRFRTPEATWRWIEHKFSIRHDLGPDPIVIGVGRDVTDQVRAREELGRERDFFEHLFETVNSLVLLMDDTGFIVRVNKTFERALGFASAEVVGKQVWEVITPPEMRGFIREAFVDIKNGGFQPVYETENITKSGERRLVEWHSTLLEATDGRLEFVLSTGTDITDRVETERRLNETLTEVTERAKEVTGLYRILALTQESRSVSDIVRHAADPIRHSFRSPAETFVHVEIDSQDSETPGFAKAQWVLRQPIQSGETDRGFLEVRYLPEDGLVPDDPFLPEERELLKQMAGVIGADLQRRDSERDLVARAVALDITADGVALIDNKSEGFVYVNRAHEVQTGYTHGELLGKSWRALVPAEVPAEALEGIEHELQAGRAWTGETVVQRKDGSRYFAEMSLTPILSNLGEVVQAVSVVRDVTQRKAAETEMRSRATALDSTAEMVLIASADGEIEYVNKAFEDQTGYSREEVIGQRTRILKSGRQEVGFYKDLWDTVLRGDAWTGELINRRKDGSEYVEEMTITPVRSELGEVVRFVAIKRDISGRKAAEAELTRLAMTDSLTGLANRRQFEIHLDQAVRGAVRRKSPGAVAYLDMDGFKKINDRFGHHAGDEALRQVADRLRNSLRRSDIVARIGGDEFAVILNDAAPEAAAGKITDLVREIRESGFAHEGQIAQLRCSAGLVPFPSGDHSPMEILALADIALYRAKQRGGDTALLYEPDQPKASADLPGSVQGHRD